MCGCIVEESHGVRFFQNLRLFFWLGAGTREKVGKGILQNLTNLLKRSAQAMVTKE